MYDKLFIFILGRQQYLVNR